MQLAPPRPPCDNGRFCPVSLSRSFFSSSRRPIIRAPALVFVLAGSSPSSSLTLLPRMDVHTLASVALPPLPPFLYWLISLSYVCPSLCVCLLPPFVSDSFSREIRDAYLGPLFPSSPAPACSRGLIATTTLARRLQAPSQGPPLP